MVLSLTIYLPTPLSLCMYTQLSHANPVPARSFQVNPALANWHSIESATICHTSKPPKLVLNPETEQGFCLNNQLVLTQILYVLEQLYTRIGLEPHPFHMKKGSSSTELFDPPSIL